MPETQAGLPSGKKMRKTLSRRILRSTILNILTVVVICCVIMVFSMQSLANSILLDSLQPMVRQSAKTVEANIHMLADRMMTIASDPRLTEASALDGGESLKNNREAVLREAAEIYELYTIALYDPEGRLVQGIDNAPESLDKDFFAILQETDNLTTHSTTLFQGKLGITMGMPIKENGQTTLYVVGTYKYDTLNDVISSINLGKNGTAYMVNKKGIVTGHPDQSMVLGQSTLSHLSDGAEQADSRIITGETGATEYTVEGERMLVAFSPIRGTQWALIIQVPKSDYYSLISNAIWVDLLFTLALLAVSILLVLRLARSISRPVKEVTNRMVALSDGDLHTDTIAVRSGDELEVLTKTLDSTLYSMNHYISDIRQVLTQIAEGNLCVEPQGIYKGDFSLIRGSLSTIAESMNETLSGFRSAASRLSAMAEDLNDQSSQLHQASQEQNQSTEALVHEVSNVKEQLTNVTVNSNETRTKTKEITRCIQSANTQMSALSGAMNDISTNAQEITKIAKDIEDIAFQTNILALNAAVEAARAGSAGKGFAIVADEVKQLATKSAKAAQHASVMVNNTRVIIQKGVELNSDTASSLQAISLVSEQISEISEHLATAVQGQENALLTMEERIDDISSIADRNLRNASGTRQSSGSLAQEAEALQAQVNRFILKEEQNR